MSSALNLVPIPLRLNLGCSDAHRKGWLNVDLCEPADVVADLSELWPWATSTVDEIAAWDIFEHLPSKLRTMNEAHRVLKPGGRLDLRVPTTDGRGAFQDPTHVSFWTPNDLFYWCENYAEWQRFHVAYGITARFKVVECDDPAKEYPHRVKYLHAILEAVK
jgi:predicted SAM-dependent methyltransferase